MLANVFGAMLIGMASEYFLSRADLRPEVRSFIVTGFLGGFTTFSTYLLDFNHLLSHEKREGGLMVVLPLFQSPPSLADGGVFCLCPEAPTALPRSL